MTPLLDVRDLSVTFATRAGPARAVDGVSFAIAPGETLALVGESGCGKTVTALAILRLLAEPPAAIGATSRVLFEGEDLLRLAPEPMWRVRGAGIGMVFQEPAASLNPVLTIGTHIEETVRAHESVTRSAARARAVELLGTVGLPEPASLRRRYPHELSGGMQQRAMLAIALAARPRLLIADEPTTALDVTLQAQILELLARLATEFHMAMLLITHNLGVAAGIANRVAVMYAAQIVETADCETLFAHPAHPYTVGLLKAAPRLDGPARPTAAIPGSVPPATAWPSGCRFHPRCHRAWARCQEDPPSLTVAPAHHARCWVVDEPKGGAA
jgi:peptide/nickel transport system ATP-binding protein